MSESYTERVRKLKLNKTHPQYSWWRAKSPRLVGRGRPPKGVRENRPIKSL